MPKHNGYEYELKRAEADCGKFGSSVCGSYSLIMGHFCQFRAWQEHDGTVCYSGAGSNNYSTEVLHLLFNIKEV